MTTAECKQLRNAILASMAKKALTGDTKAAQILLDHLDTVAPRDANNQVLDNFLEALDLTAQRLDWNISDTPEDLGDTPDSTGG